MAKILNQYIDLTATAIKNKASNTCTMVVSGNQVICTDVSTVKIKSIIGSSSNAVSALCSSANVNKWSGFSPREFYISGGVLYNRVKTPYQMGSFCGYNHNATAPAFAYGTDSFYVMDATMSPVTVTATIELGEINWNQYGIYKIALESKINGAVAGTTYTTITSLGGCEVSNTFDAYYNTNQTIINTIYFCDTYNNKLCAIPNVSTFNTLLGINKVAYIRNILISEDLLSLYPDWTVMVNNQYLDQANHTYSIFFGGIWELDNYVTTTRTLYVSKNDGAYVSCNKTIYFNGSNEVNVNGTLPFSLAYNDYVDFELR